MPSNKPRVASYLDDAEYVALKEFSLKKGISFSEGVGRLIREQLVEKSPKHKDAFLRDENVERIEALEEESQMTGKILVAHVKFNEKLEEQMAELRERVEHLYSENIKRNSEPITDEQIAAITNQPM